jgi:hypothetical protein
MSVTPSQPPTPAPATIRRPGRAFPLPLALLVVLVLVLVIIFSFAAHRENANEKLVGRIVESVQRNDMSPIAKEFNAVTREQLTRGSVGRLSDQIAPFGKVKRVEETTPKDSPPRRHTFIVHFEKGDWNAIMILDSEGKVTGFHLTPVAARS